MMRYIFLAQGGLWKKNHPQIQMPEERGDVEALIWLVHNIGIVLKFYTLLYLFGTRCAPNYYSSWFKGPYQKSTKKVTLKPIFTVPVPKEMKYGSTLAKWYQMLNIYFRIAIIRYIIFNFRVILVMLHNIFWSTHWKLNLNTLTTLDKYWWY